jgi:hypothetical protein
MQLHRRSAAKFTIAAVATIGVLSGAAYATGLAGSAGSIHACANKRTGALRQVGSSKACRKTERAVSWNVAGARGPAGARGAVGARGPAGATGLRGATGLQGIAGTNAALALAYPSALFNNPAAGQYGTPSGINFGQVPCTSGKKVVGGGVHTSSSAQVVDESYPTNGFSTTPGQAGWGATVKNGFGNSDATFTVFAICVNP